MPCLFLPEEQLALLDTDKEYYCPFCVQDKIKVDLIMMFNWTQNFPY